MITSIADAAQSDLRHSQRHAICKRFKEEHRYNFGLLSSGIGIAMIGTVLKQLSRALGQFAGYHTRRLFGMAGKPVAAASDGMPAASAAEPEPPYAATEASIGSLSDEIGLNPDFERLVEWPCHPGNTPPLDVRSKPLYKLWTTIPHGRKWTQYFPAYEAIFGPIRRSQLRILEIGIWKGSSLTLWKRYFEHPQTIIVGIDVWPECVRFNAPADRVHVRIGSQTDAQFLATVVKEFGPFDLIIDDGSHHSSHIIESFNHLFGDGLKDTGIYFVEDLHANYWHPWRDSRKSFLDVCKEMLEHMHAHYRSSSPADFLIERPSERRTAAIEVPRIAKMIKEIRFFDSMVAIYKANLEYVPYFLCSEA